MRPLIVLVIKLQQMPKNPTSKPLHLTEKGGGEEMWPS